MKYLVLIHSNPQPWGHPTGAFVAEQQVLSQDDRDRGNAEFDELLDELSQRGELLAGEALGDPATSRLFRVANGQRVASDGPYSETKEHLAGFFLIDVADAARAEQVAARMSGAGETVELRPIWVWE